MLKETLSNFRPRVPTSCLLGPWHGTHFGSRRSESRSVDQAGSDFRTFPNFATCSKTAFPNGKQLGSNGTVCMPSPKSVTMPFSRSEARNGNIRDPVHSPIRNAFQQEKRPSEIANNVPVAGVSEKYPCSKSTCINSSVKSRWALALQRKSHQQSKFAQTKIQIGISQPVLLNIHHDASFPLTSMCLRERTVITRIREKKVTVEVHELTRMFTKTSCQGMKKPLPVTAPVSAEPGRDHKCQEYLGQQRHDA